MNDYSDIINMKYPFKEKGSNINRAAQFSPFSALTGYDKEIKEKQKILNKKIELTEQKKDILDFKLEYIKNNKDLEVKVTYFVKEKNLDEGQYTNIINKIKKIDNIKKQIIIDDKIISIKDIIDIEIKE